MHQPLDEAGKQISAANVGTIKQAIQGMMKAFQPIMSLIGMQASEALPAEDSERVAEAERRLQEARNVGEWMEAAIHRDFTMTADYMFGDGRLTRDERIALSSAIGKALDAFRSQLESGAPNLYTRDPYAQPDTAMSEADQSEAGQDTAEDITTDEIVPLQEGAVNQDGTALIKLIQPGWGSSGYYPAAVLERDGPRVFTAGTKMFWDHPTLAEEAARPEGSLTTLASELIEDAQYLETGPRGPGLYAKAKVFSAYRAAIDDLAPHIGTSIRASGKARMGEADGRTGRIIDAIVSAQSVDYVTTPGAGGQVVALFEAARRTPEETPLMSDDTALNEAVKAVRALQTQNQQLQIALMKQQAIGYRDSKIATLGLPPAIVARVREAIGDAAPTVENDPLTLDSQAFDKLIEAAANREVLYAQALAPTGVITGMGGAGGWGTHRSEPTVDELQKQSADLFGRLGLSEAVATSAANRR